MINYSRIRGSDGKKLFTTTHGMTGTRTHKSWASMIRRCNKGSIDKKQYYWDRGIRVCKRWIRFENFLSDMGIRPSGKTLERVNNDKGYCPSNCRWATRYEQSLNRQTNVYVEWKGKRMTVKQLAEKANHNYYKFRSRILLGWTLQEAVETP